MAKGSRLQGALNRAGKSQDAPAHATASSTPKDNKGKEQIDGGRKRSPSEMTSEASDAQKQSAQKQTAPVAVDPKEQPSPAVVPPKMRPASTRWDVPDLRSQKEIRSKRASDPKQRGASVSLADAAKMVEFKHAWVPPEGPSHPLIKNGEAILRSCFDEIHTGLNQRLTDFTGNLEMEFGGFHKTMASMKLAEAQYKKDIARLEGLRVTEGEELSTLRRDIKDLRGDIISKDKTITEHTTTIQSIRDEYAKFKDNHFVDRKKERAVHEKEKEEHSKLKKKHGDLQLSYDELTLRFDSLKIKYDELSSDYEVQKRRLQEVEETSAKQQNLLDQADAIIDDIYFQVGTRGGDLSWIGDEYDDVQQMIADRKKAELEKSAAGTSDVPPPPPPPPIGQVEEPELEIIKETSGDGPTMAELAQTMAAQVKTIKTEVIEEWEKPGAVPSQHKETTSSTADVAPHPGAEKIGALLDSDDGDKQSSGKKPKKPKM